MKIENKILISIDASDLKDGHFYNKTVTEVADGCFNNMPGLISVNLPKVKKIGGSCFSDNAAITTISLPLLAQCGGSCFSDNAAITTISLRKKKYSVKNVDGYCFVIEAQKTSKGIHIYTGYNFLSMRKKEVNKEACFVAEKDNFFAHGGTVKKAVSDLQFKIVAEKLKKEPINADTIVSVQHYRLVTGACEMGCNSWMQQNGITKQEMKASELLPLLKKTNAYGFERFKQLVTF